jgi:predicted transcriptional regulator
MWYNFNMDTKTPKQGRTPKLFPYRAEDLEPRNMIAEAASEDSFIERNRDAINAALKEGYDDIARGDVRTMEQVAAGLKKPRRTRKA